MMIIKPNRLSVDYDLKRINDIRKSVGLPAGSPSPDRKSTNKNNDKTIKISIIVPVFKTEQYLRKCLDSIVNQTLQDIEILVVNSSSPDDSQKIIDVYARKYPTKIVPLFQKDRGLGDSRNFGLKKARGKYVMFIDSDDTFSSPTSCESLFNYAESQKCDIVVGRMIYDYGQTTKEIYGFEKKYQKYYNSPDLRNKKETAFGSAPVMNKIYRRDLLISNNIKFPKYRLYEDILFCLKSWYFSKRIGCISDIVYNYTQRTNPDNPSITQKISIKHFNDRVFGFYSIYKFLRKVRFYNRPGLAYLNWLVSSISEMPDKIEDPDQRAIAKEKLNELMKRKEKMIRKYESRITN